MTWFKVDDQVAFGPKHVEAGNAAVGAWVRAGAWSAAQLTDGFIPLSVAHSIAPRKIWLKLAEAKGRSSHGLVELRPDGYQLHDYLVYNESAEKVKSKREAWAARQGKARGCNPNDVDGLGKMSRSDTVRDSSAYSQRDSASPDPDPDPDPDPEISSSASARTPAPATQELAAPATARSVQRPVGATELPTLAPDVARSDASPTIGQPKALAGTSTGGSSPVAGGGVDYLGMASVLADAGVSFGAEMLDWMARGKILRTKQRTALVEAHAEHVEARNVAERAKQLLAAQALPASGPVDELQAWIADRWVEARRKRGLGAQAPDSKLIAEIAWIAVGGADAAAPDREGWRPTAKHIAAFWIRRYLSEVQDRAGGVSDREYPLAWLVRRCREYPLPKLRDMRPEQDPAVRPAAPDVHAVLEGRPTPSGTTTELQVPIPTDLVQQLMAVGEGGAGRVRPRQVH